MSMETDLSRAKNSTQRGEILVHAYCSGVGNSYGAEPMETIADAIADLLHAAAADCLDPDAVAEKAMRYFKGDVAERRGEPPPERLKDRQRAIPGCNP